MSQDSESPILVDGASGHIKNALKDILASIGEDPTRSGILETPDRVIRSYQELYRGYHQDVSSLFKTFDEEHSKQIVLLKDIEFYSMCEHHMLPFVGKAHIAYIPEGRVIGISKLARILDVYARRLQIQERLGLQVTGAIMEHLKPAGAACILSAEHYCMRMRGVSKQNSVMVTSSLEGIFMDDIPARQELLALINI